jgi:hypothetical protein
MLCDTGDRGAASGRTEFFSMTEHIRNPTARDDPEVMNSAVFNGFIA